MTSPLLKHREGIRKLAKSLRKTDIYHWLVEFGYFPENYVLPPCFRVARRPTKPKLLFVVTKNGKFSPDRTQCVNVHFPKTALTDRTFGVIHPKIHNDIAYHLSTNWSTVVRAMFPSDSQVCSYGFPIPIDAKSPARIGYLRSGWMIYEYVGQMEGDVTAA